MYFIWSVLLCSSVWNTSELENKTEDILFLVFQNVSRANTVNLNASPLHLTHVYVKQVYYNVMAALSRRQLVTICSFAKWNVQKQ
jgi:hypothetical protein